MDLKTRVQMEVVSRGLEVTECYRRLKREEAEAKREQRPMLPNRRAFHNEAIAFAKAQVQSAEATFAGVSKYPPLSRYV